jgi:hypothetical protein
LKGLAPSNNESKIAETGHTRLEGVISRAIELQSLFRNFESTFLPVTGALFVGHFLAPIENLRPKIQSKHGIGLFRSAEHRLWSMLFWDAPLLEMEMGEVEAARCQTILHW